MIDLHTHTNQSDGSLEPAALVHAALQANLDALAITDHDTLCGYDIAAPVARASGLTLVCGAEISTRMDRAGSARTTHLLAYFLDDNTGAPASLRAWLDRMLEFRRDRNRRLAARLAELGVYVTLEDAEALGGVHTGRPHFARVLMAKGYASGYRDAFDRYLGEHAPAYVERTEPEIGRAISEIRAAGGIAVLAHPIRLNARDQVEEVHFIGSLVEAGLDGLEVYHTDHTQADVARFQAAAAHFSLAVTGGSDFHGEAKIDAVLGAPPIERRVLDRLRERFAGRRPHPGSTAHGIQ